LCHTQRYSETGADAISDKANSCAGLARDSTPEGSNRLAGHATRSTPGTLLGLPSSIVMMVAAVAVMGTSIAFIAQTLS